MADQNEELKGNHPEQDPTLEQGQIGDSELQRIHAQLMREKEEPSEGFSPVPIFFLFVFSALTFWAGIYIESNSGDFSAYAYDPDYKATDLEAGPAIDYDSSEWLLSHGERRFNQHCVACHQTSGDGVPGAFPTLIGTDWVVGDEARVINVLLYGLQGEIEVNGRTYNGVMPAFSNTPGLRNDRDIAAVVSYIRNSWGNSASLVLQDDVAAVRSAMGDRGPWRGSDLLELHPMP